MSGSLLGHRLIAAVALGLVIALASQPQSVDASIAKVFFLNRGHHDSGAKPWDSDRRYNWNHYTIQRERERQERIRRMKLRRWMEQYDEGEEPCVGLCYYNKLMAAKKAKAKAKAEEREKEAKEEELENFPRDSDYEADEGLQDSYDDEPEVIEYEPHPVRSAQMYPRMRPIIFSQIKG